MEKHASMRTFQPSLNALMVGHLRCRYIVERSTPMALVSSEHEEMQTISALGHADGSYECDFRRHPQVSDFPNQSEGGKRVEA